MNQQQKNYVLRRVSAVLEEKRTVKVTIANPKHKDLARMFFDTPDGDLQLKSPEEIKKIFKTDVYARIHHAFKLPESYVQEIAEYEAKVATVEKEDEIIARKFTEIKDQVLLGDCKDALEIINDLKALKLEDL